MSILTFAQQITRILLRGKSKGALFNTVYWFQFDSALKWDLKKNGNTHESRIDLTAVLFPSLPSIVLAHESKSSVICRELKWPTLVTCLHESRTRASLQAAILEALCCDQRAASSHARRRATPPAEHRRASPKHSRVANLPAGRRLRMV